MLKQCVLSNLIPGKEHSESYSEHSTIIGSLVTNADTHPYNQCSTEGIILKSHSQHPFIVTRVTFLLDDGNG